MNPLFYFAIGAIAVVLFIVDRFISTAGSPEAPEDEDVPVIPTHPTVTWWIDKDGKLHSGKTK